MMIGISFINSNLPERRCPGPNEFGAVFGYPLDSKEAPTADAFDRPEAVVPLQKTPLRRDRGLIGRQRIEGLVVGFTFWLDPPCKS